MGETQAKKISWRQQVKHITKKTFLLRSSHENFWYLPDKIENTHKDLGWQRNKDNNRHVYFTRDNSSHPFVIIGHLILWLSIQFMLIFSPTKAEEKSCLVTWHSERTQGSECYLFCSRISSRWSHGVVVITSALHAEGRQFEPGCDHVFALPFCLTVKQTITISFNNWCSFKQLISYQFLFLSNRCVMSVRCEGWQWVKQYYIKAK